MHTVAYRYAAYPQNSSAGSAATGGPALASAAMSTVGECMPGLEEEEDEDNPFTFGRDDGSPWTLAACRDFLDLVMTQRKALGDPVPSDSQPLPPDSCCRFCKRSRRTRNPIAVSTYKNLIYLPFKSASANECVPCRMGQLWGYKGWTRVELIAELEDENGDFVVFYMFGVVCWELRYVDPSTCPVKVSSRLPAVTPQRITQSDSTVLESDMCLGNLWPTGIFEMWFSYTPDKKSLVSINHNGQRVTGIILSPDYGVQIGVIRLTQKSMSTMKREFEVANNNDELRQEAMGEIWGRAQKRQCITARGEKTKEGEAAKGATLTQKREKADDGDFMAEIWDTGGSFVFKSGGGGSAGSSRGGGSAGSSRGGGRHPGNQATSSTTDDPARGGKLGTLNKQATERLKIIQTSSQVNLAAVHLLAQFEDAKAGPLVTVKAIQGMIDKVDARMVQKFMDVYSMDYDAPEHVPSEAASHVTTTVNGMQVLGDLSATSRKLAAAKSMIEFMAETSPGDGIEALLSQSKKAGLQISSSMLTSLFTRSSNTLIDKEKYAEWTELLLPELQDSSDGLSINIAGSDEAKTELQTNVIMSALLDILRSKDKMDKARQFVFVVDAKLVKSDLILDKNFQAELTHVMSVASVASATDTDLDAIDKSKTELLRGNNMRLQKAFMSFPTGQALCAAVDLEVTAARKDGHMLRELGLAQKLIREEMATGADRFDQKAEGKASRGFKSSHTLQLIDLSKKLRLIGSGASQRFKSRNTTALESVDTALSANAMDLRTFITNNIREPLQEALDGFKALLLEPAVSVSPDVKKSVLNKFSVSATILPTADDLQLVDFVGKDIHVDYQTWRDDVRNCLTTIQSSVVHFCDDRPMNVDLTSNQVMMLATLLRGETTKLDAITDLQATMGDFRRGLEVTLKAAVQHSFTANLQATIPFASELVKVTVREGLKLDSFIGVAAEISSRRETLAVSYLKFAEFFAARGGAPPTVKVEEREMPAESVIACVWLQHYFLQFTTGIPEKGDASYVKKLAASLTACNNEKQTWANVKSSRLNQCFAKNSEHSPVKFMMDALDERQASKHATVVASSQAVVADIVNSAKEVLEDEEMKAMMKIVQETKWDKLQEKDVFPYTMSSATRNVYTLWKAYIDTAPLREAFSTVGIEGPPSTASKTADALKCPAMKGLSTVCANLTCAQALWRALGEKETRRALLHRCQQGLEKQGVFPTASMKELVAKTIKDLDDDAEQDCGMQVQVDPAPAAAKPAAPAPAAAKAAAAAEPAAAAGGGLPPPAAGQGKGRGRGGKGAVAAAAAAAAGPAAAAAAMPAGGKGRGKGKAGKGRGAGLPPPAKPAAKKQKST